MARPSFFFRRCLLAVVGLALAAPALAQGNVGVTSVAIGEPRGRPPAAAERVLRVGIDVVASERVTTGANDRAHLVFLDGSALTVGPNSDLTIDRFIYDPTTRQGELAMNATRGAFRFVGGAISKKSEVVIRTPSGNIGVRGGIMTVVIGADGSVTATFLYGIALTATNTQGTQTAIRAGSTITIPYNGPPRAPIVLPPGSYQTYLALFETALGGNNALALNDEVLLTGLLAIFNAPNNPASWLATLQSIASQSITATNANKPVTGAPTATSSRGGGGTAGGDN